ncbi:hypothetical protein PVAND_016072 [Polypedilum vanderplanki]|uniref:C2H2-type domain-containing protein n=1 Tax=Polypedilum vanderplanki TaxID=319348 RepID=A0A9J6BES5_POLVA|nr:hypothetical protein PVAND_016072 [Polypedilum vanderplanki]
MPRKILKSEIQSKPKIDSKSLKIKKFSIKFKKDAKVLKMFEEIEVNFIKNQEFNTSKQDGKNFLTIDANKKDEEKIQCHICFNLYSSNKTLKKHLKNIH